ncbi:hypothetical protein P4U97_01315 [Bacillus swezeyi]|uniref:hypothetical protein n=1 Tax=Bacillus swezeyi TaxID=1925020 RepID=UPI002E240686|nr:hypothetical protein [Bacillus swezeyi]
MNNEEKNVLTTYQDQNVFHLMDEGSQLMWEMAQKMKSLQAFSHGTRKPSGYMAQQSLKDIIDCS